MSLDSWEAFLHFAKPIPLYGGGIFGKKNGCPFAMVPTIVKEGNEERAYYQPSFVPFLTNFQEPEVMQNFKEELACLDDDQLGCQTLFFCSKEKQAKPYEEGLIFKMLMVQDGVAIGICNDLVCGLSTSADTLVAFMVEADLVGVIQAVQRVTKALVLAGH